VKEIRLIQVRLKFLCFWLASGTAIEIISNQGLLFLFNDKLVCLHTMHSLKLHTILHKTFT